MAIVILLLGIIVLFAGLALLVLTLSTAFMNRQEVNRSLAAIQGMHEDDRPPLSRLYLRNSPRGVADSRPTTKPRASVVVLILLATQRIGTSIASSLSKCLASSAERSSAS